VAWFYGLFGTVAIVMVGWFIRYAISVWRGDYGHAAGTKRVWWIPGGGSHGMGQVPPLIPDSDPAEEIR